MSVRDISVDQSKKHFQHVTLEPEFKQYKQDQQKPLPRHNGTRQQVGDFRPIEHLKKMSVDPEAGENNGKLGYNKLSYQVPTKPGWTAADNNRGQANIAKRDLSPTGMLADPTKRYQDIDRLIAHRGLVDLARGIPENSSASINNAVVHGINNVEIDVQALGDGTAVPLHDTALDRPFGGMLGTVADANYAQLQGKNLWIKNPPDANGVSTYTPTNSQFESLDSLLQNAFLHHPGLSIVLDPKNLSAAEAAVKVLASHPWMLSRVAMKTYANYWRVDPLAKGRTPSDVLADAFRSVNPNLSPSMLKIDPVINPNLAPNTNQSLSYIKNEVNEWAKNFEVPQIELPGYWKSGWWDQKTALVNDWIRQDSLGLSPFKNNPLQAGNLHYLANIGTGYRYEDFEKDGVFYDWGMDGKAKPDNVSPVRRTAGAEASANGWLTTDVPLQEANAIVDKDIFGEGNANVDS